MPLFAPQAPAAELRLSEVVSALSFALDITEGQPEGHSVRTCMIGMRIAKEIYLSPKQRSALFYALLLKDLGCSSNASKVCYLFSADDRTAKSDLKTANWTKTSAQIKYLLHTVAPGAGFLTRFKKMMSLARHAGTLSRELIELRCDRGATIARQLQMPEETALAIRSLDEHWNGQGHAQGLKGEDIPILARILNLAQTVEVFHARHGLNAAMQMAQSRSNTWFDPQLVKVLRSIEHHSAFWNLLHSNTPLQTAMAFEPENKILHADASTLDRIAAGFSQIIDAKSPWTYRHSEGVAEIATGIATVLNLSPHDTQLLRRAALLHDIGKLGISNLILDKPGKLDETELTQMRKHPLYTRQILERVSGFREIAATAAAHHERLDGKGYHCGLDASNLSLHTRILSVADTFEALASHRPYRQDLSEEDVMSILQKSTGTALDPVCVEALKVFLDQSHYTPIPIAA